MPDATETDRPAHMTSADAHVYAVQIEGLLKDLQRWQREHQHIADYRTTQMIASLAEAARLADLLVRQDTGEDHRAALERFRVRHLNMDPAEAAQLRTKAENAMLAAPSREDKEEAAIALIAMTATRSRTAHLVAAKRAHDEGEHGLCGPECEPTTGADEESGATAANDEQVPRTEPDH